MPEDFTIKVVYRGDWCPWCVANLKDFNDHLGTIEAGAALSSRSRRGAEIRRRFNMD